MSPKYAVEFDAPDLVDDQSSQVTDQERARVIIALTESDPELAEWIAGW